MAANNGKDVMELLSLLINKNMQSTQPVSTNISVATPQGDFFKNQPKLANDVGSPMGLYGGLSQDELLDIVMSMTMPMGSIRGGKTAISTLQQLKGLAKKYGIKTPRKLHPQTIEDYMTSNKMNVARMKNKQVLDKYNISDPDKEEFTDIITRLLTRSKN